MKRVKYNWLFAIDDLGLQDDFAVYKAECDLKQHRNGKKSFPSIELLELI